MKNDVLGSLGPLWRQVWNRRGKQECFRAKVETILEVSLAHFRCFGRRIFECIFMRSHFLHFGRFWSPKVSKREVLGGTFDAILGAGPKGENRCFMYTGARFREFWRVWKSMKFETFFARILRICVFSRFLRSAYFATKSMLQNSKFLRAAYIAAYKIHEHSDEISKFVWKFTDFYGNSIFTGLFFAKIH